MDGLNYYGGATQDQLDYLIQRGAISHLVHEVQLWVHVPLSHPHFALPILILDRQSNFVHTIPPFFANHCYDPERNFEACNHIKLHHSYLLAAHSIGRRGQESRTLVSTYASPSAAAVWLRIPVSDLFLFFLLSR